MSGGVWLYKGGRRMREGRDAAVCDSVLVTGIRLFLLFACLFPSSMELGGFCEKNNRVCVQKCVRSLHTYWFGCSDMESFVCGSI